MGIKIYAFLVIDFWIMQLNVIYLPRIIDLIESKGTAALVAIHLKFYSNFSTFCNYMQS